MLRGLPHTLTGWLITLVAASMILSLTWLAVKEYMISNPCADGNVLHDLQAQIPHDQYAGGVVIASIVTKSGHFWQHAYRCEANLTEIRGLADLSSSPMARIRYGFSRDANGQHVQLDSIHPEER